MGTLQDALSFYQSAVENFDVILQQSFEETKSAIADFDRLNLRAGKKVDGSYIGFYASLAYSAKKYNKSSLAGLGRVDLYLSGDWSNAIEVTVNQSGFSTDSTDLKATKLETEYTSLIYGLPYAYNPDYVQIIMPVIINKLKAQ